LLGTPKPASLPAGIVAWWKCDEGSGSTLADSSGNGNNATLYGSPTWITYATGINAIRMNGNTCYGDAGDPAILRFTSADKFTISAWVKTTLGNFTDIIVGKYGSSNGYKLLQWFGSEQFRFVSQSTTMGNFGPGYPASVNWHHVVFTFDATYYNSYGSGLYGDGLFYYDGSLYNSNIHGQSALASSGTNLILGLGDTSYSNYALCDVRIYNIILSAGDISSLYSAGPA